MLVATVAALVVAAYVVPLVAGEGYKNALPFVLGAIVFAGGMAGFASRQRAAIVSHANRPDGVELEYSVQARARVFVDGVLLTAALAVVLLMLPVVSAPVACLAVVVFMVADFWIRYTVLTRRVSAGKVEQAH